jgi:iron complex outermembrane receptor protein
MRGVASGGDGNHSGPQPSVGMYLDEQPITTIVKVRSTCTSTTSSASNRCPDRRARCTAPVAGRHHAPDHAYKPDTTGLLRRLRRRSERRRRRRLGPCHRRLRQSFRSTTRRPRCAWSVGRRKTPVSSTTSMANARIPSSASPRTTPNASNDNYNDYKTLGARAALKIDFNDNWTVTPTIMGQRQKARHLRLRQNRSASAKISHAYPERAEDRWAQACADRAGQDRQLRSDLCLRAPQARCR